jgi:protocatechuate 3,4-dioxygenase beta subunit
MAMKLALLVLGARMLCAQMQSSGAAIEGVVMDAMSGVPLPDVAVLTTRNDVRGLTDDRGRYAFRKLPAGFYQIYVHQPGYAMRSVYARVLAGQEVKGVDLKLDREAVLSGRVLDRDKNPVPQARVNIRGQGYQNGRPFLTSFHSMNTNDLGEYRFTGIAPGRYYVEAEPKPLMVRKVQSGDPHEPREPVLADVRTYYGNSLNFEGASPLTFTAGQQMEGVDIILLREKTMCITGSVSGGDPGQRYALQLSEPMPSSQSRVASGNVSAGDDFEICGVPPGSYNLRSFTSGDLRYAWQPVVVANRSVTVPALMLAPGSKFAGMVTVDGAKPEDPLPGRMLVNLEPKDRIRIAGETTSIAVEPTGQFSASGVVLDQYWLTISGQLPGYYVKQATIKGRDVLREPLRTGQGDLSVVLGSDGGALSGTVNTADNQTISNAIVLLPVFPLPDQLAWGDIRMAYADQNGFFNFPTLPPGAYRLLAFPPLPEGSAYDPNLVRSNLGNAMPITLAPKEKKSVTITPK